MSGGDVRTCFMGTKIIDTTVNWALDDNVFTDFSVSK